VFAALAAEFDFEADVAAEERTAKVCPWYGPGSPWREDALTDEPWAERGAAVFCNPPYNRSAPVNPWVERAYQESRRGVTVAMVLPARTDTAWWQDWVMRADEIRLIRGRLRFVDPETMEPAPASAPFPVAIVVWRPHWDGPPRVQGWEV